MLRFKNNLLGLGLSIAGLVVVLDQITKYLASNSFSFSAVYPILPGFSLTLHHNTGAAFGFLSEAPGWQRWFFAGLALLVSVCILAWLNQLNTKRKLEAWGLALILGGALGNLIDRLLYGYVIDFIVLYYKQWQWPTFNIADSAICVGVVLLIMGMFQKESKAES